MDVSHNPDGTFNIVGISPEHLHFIAGLVADTVGEIVAECILDRKDAEALVWTQYANDLLAPIADGIDTADEDEDFEAKPCECPPCVLKFHQDKADSAPFN